MNKIQIYGLAAVTLFGGTMVSCDTDAETMDIQKPLTYDEQYYQNLRDFKMTPHEVSFAYYEAWAPAEGADGYKDPASMGERIIGLPDSIDIVNLWMGVPTPETHPIAYKDMKETQRLKGTRFVMHADACHFNHTIMYNGKEVVMRDLYDTENNTIADDVIKAYGDWIVASCEEVGLDGVDIDFEPEGRYMGWTAENLSTLVKYLSSFYGPKSGKPRSLLIVDTFRDVFPDDIEEYVDYYVMQDYSDQTGGLRPSRYNQAKTIHCETFGNLWQTGGKILEYARWEPADGGKKAGVGAFYLGRNYNSTSGIPYNEFRQAIQIMNPAVKK